MRERTVTKKSTFNFKQMVKLSIARFQVIQNECDTESAIKCTAKISTEAKTIHFQTEYDLNVTYADYYKPFFAQLVLQAIEHWLPSLPIQLFPFDTE